MALSRPGRVSGVAVAVARLSTLLPRELAWTPMVIGPELDERVRRDSPWNRAVGMELVSWPRGAGPVEQVMAVVTRLRELGADVVIPNDCEHGFVAAAMDHVRGLRCGLWLHADHHDGDVLVERCAELADSWRAVSTSGRARAIALADRLELVLRRSGEPLPAPVDLGDAPSPVPSERAAIAILYAGRLEKQVKRVLDLARIADALAEAGTPFEMRVVGDGPARAELVEAMATHIAMGRVSVEAPRALDEMRAAFEWADVTLLVSASEGMPTVVLESLAAGRPVVVSDHCGGAAELVAKERGRIGSVFPVGAAFEAAELLAGWAADRVRLASAGPAARALTVERLCTEVRSNEFATFAAEAHGGKRRWNPEVPLEGAGWWRLIRRAIGAIGPCSPQELEVLACEWLTASGVAADGVWTPGGPLLPLELPRVESPHSRLVRSAIERLVVQGAKRIGVYGAGAHTRKVIDEILAESRIEMLIDDRAGHLNGPPAEIRGLPVLQPKDACERGIDAILISSDEHEREMLLRARGWAAGLRLETVYESPA